MTKKQMLYLLAYIEHLWPRLFDLPDDENRLDLMIQVWLDVLGDLDVNVCRAAVVAMNGREFPPTPGQLRAAIAADAGPGLPDWDEFWQWVVTAASRGSVLLLDDHEPIECPWPALADLVSENDLAQWARDGITMHDLEMIQQAHVRRRFEPAVARALRGGLPDAPAIARQRATVREVDEPRRVGQLATGWLGAEEAR